MFVCIYVLEVNRPVGPRLLVCGPLCRLFVLGIFILLLLLVVCSHCWGRKASMLGPQGLTICNIFLGGSADFEIIFLAIQEEIHGIFLSYTLVHDTSWVCNALAKSKHEFSLPSKSLKVVRPRGPCYWGHEA